MKFSGESKSAVVARATVVAVALVASVVVYRAVFIKRVKIVGNETVTYSGEATAAEARALGEVLLAVGYFNGEGGGNVRLWKGDEGTVVGFNLPISTWKLPGAADGFRRLGRTIAPAIGGPPLMLKIWVEEAELEEAIPIE
jgi:hypothetical protein